MTDTATTTHGSEPTDIRPGDRVTIVLFSDWWTRTSFVDADGFYHGCGAVTNGRARVISVYRDKRLIWALPTPASASALAPSGPPSTAVPDTTTSPPNSPR